MMWQPVAAGKGKCAQSGGGDVHARSLLNNEARGTLHVTTCHTTWMNLVFVLVLLPVYVLEFVKAFQLLWSHLVGSRGRHGSS